MSKVYFKVLNEGRKAQVGSTQWPEVGEWTQEEFYVRLCQSGWHLSTFDGLSRWINYVSGPRIQLFLAEGAGGSHVDKTEGKTAFAKARLIRQLPLNKKVLSDMARKHLGTDIKSKDTVKDILARSLRQAKLNKVKSFYKALSSYWKINFPIHSKKYKTYDNVW